MDYEVLLLSVRSSSCAVGALFFFGRPGTISPSAVYSTARTAVLLAINRLIRLIKNFREMF